MKAVLGSFGLGVVARGSGQISALVVSIVAARVLGPHGFGVYAIASVLVVIAQQVLWGGVYDFVVKSRQADADIDTPFWINLGIGVVGAVVIVAAAPLLSRLTDLPGVLALMLALAPTTILGAWVAWSEAVLLREAKLRMFYVLSMVVELVAGTTAVVCFWAGVGVWSFVIYRYMQLALGAVLNSVIAQRLPRCRYDRSVAHTVLTFANRINGSRIVNLAGVYAPDLLLGFFAGAASTASYRFANRIVVGVSDMFFGPVAKQAWVSLAAHPDDPAARGRIWAGLLQILALIVWPALWGIATLSQGLVDLLAGPSWHDAASVVVLMAMARTLLVFEVFFEPLLGVRNRATYVFQMRCLLAGLSVVAFLLLAQFGAIGGGICQIVIGLASAVISIRTSLHETSLSLARIVQIMIPPAIGGALAVIASLLASSSVQGYPLGVRISTAVIAAIVLWGLGLAAVERNTALLRPLRTMS